MSQSRELDPVFVNALQRPNLYRRRVADARRHPSPRTWALRAASFIVIGTVASVVATRMCSVAVQPMVATYQKGAHIRTLQRQLAYEEALAQRLRDEAAYLRTSAGIEQEARRRGWVFPGEVSLAIKRDSDSVDTDRLDRIQLDTTDPAPQAEDRNPARPALADRIRLTLETCFAVFGGTGRPR